MNELAKQLVVNAGKVDRYQNKQHLAGMNRSRRSSCARTAATTRSQPSGMVTSS